MAARQQLRHKRTQPAPVSIFFEKRVSFFGRLTLGFRSPIAQFDVFLYFTAFVAVFFWFVLTVIDLGEGMFGIANHIGDNVEVNCFKRE